MNWSPKWLLLMAIWSGHVFGQVQQSGSAHIELLETHGSKSGNVPILRIRLKLVGDKDGRLKLRANQVCITLTDGAKKCNWLFVQFFSGVQTIADIQTTTVHVDDSYPLVHWVDGNAELNFDIKAGMQNEAQLLFGGVDISRANSLSFGMLAPVKIKQR